MLFDPLVTPALQLKNRMVMSPMTRSRAGEGSVPTAMNAEYYSQRASAGLIITEGTSPSPNGLGYARIPGMFNEAQVRGWKLVTEAVHAQGGRIFLQLMHTGRVTHLLNLPPGAEVVGPSPEVCPGQMYTDAKGMEPHSAPRPMTEADIRHAIDEYAQSSRLAIDAGFDGVELHGANGYLIEQFLNPKVNLRTDGYGGNVEARNRFAIEVASAAAQAIGAEKVGMRLSPYGIFNGTGAFPELESQYLALTKALDGIGILYLHVLDHSALGSPPVPETIKDALHKTFSNIFILAGGFNKESAERALTENRADLIAFGRPFLANPDLPRRFSLNAALNAPDASTFYLPGPKGYTDYPALDA